MTPPMTEEQAKAVYRILVDVCEAEDDDLAEWNFVHEIMKDFSSQATCIAAGQKTAQLVQQLVAQTHLSNVHPAHWVCLAK
jgi:hypothetical protein